MTGTPPEGDDPFAYDLSDETFEAPPGLDRWTQYEHKVRVGLMWTCGLLLGVLVSVQIVMGFNLDPDQYQVFIAPLSAADTLFAAVLGAAALYYFTRRD